MPTGSPWIPWSNAFRPRLPRSASDSDPRLLNVLRAADGVLARLCHDALASGEGYVAFKLPRPLLRLMAQLQHAPAGGYSGFTLVRFGSQGRERLFERLRARLAAQPGTQAHVEAEVMCFWIITSIDSYLAVTDADVAEVLGVMRFRPGHGAEA